VIVTKALPPRLRATKLYPRPGEFDTGSDRSRAAARMLLEEQRTFSGTGILSKLLVVGNPAPKGTRCTCKSPTAGTCPVCKCFMPATRMRGL
jgi:hypothetical protein